MASPVTALQPAPPLELSPDDPTLFIDRDLSTLRFYERVLEEARDTRNPLLERVKFLAIVGTNVDDFLASRGLALRKRKAKAVVVEEVLTALVRDAHVYWRRHLRPRLREAGVEVVEYARLTSAEQAWTSAQFAASIRPLLEPHPWPLPGEFAPLPSHGLTLLVYSAGDAAEPRYLVRVPEKCSALLPLHWDEDAGRPEPRTHWRFVWVDEVIRAHLLDLFPNMREPRAAACRLLRDADLKPPADDEPWTARHVMSEVRRIGTHPVVVAIVERRTPAGVLRALERTLDLRAEHVRLASRVFDFRRLWDVHRIPRPDLRHPERSPRLPRRLVGQADLFAAIRHADVLLHHPFDAFEPVLGLVRLAAGDPFVTDIAMSLYRTDRRSTIVAALCGAARRGVRVRVIVELRARFDEERNARAAISLAEAGAEVHHGPTGVKVHAKMLLVSRREPDGVRRYAHVSSGNYNSFTARAYTDVALLTTNPAITADVQALFDMLMSNARGVPLSVVLAAPAALRANVLALIEREIAHARLGRPARAILKMNSLVDREVILALYRASQAGVELDLLVRGTCCLRPHVPGTSDRIRVRSIVGRHLEHSRIWYFQNGGEDEVYLGSADLMPRNLDRRVEVMVPVLDLGLRHELRSRLDDYLRDNVKSRELGPDGSYTRVRTEAGDPPFECQASLSREGHE
jgi:polyphosphate kinase